MGKNQPTMRQMPSFAMFNSKKKKAIEAQRAAAASLGVEAKEEDIKETPIAEVQASAEHQKKVDALYPFTNEYILLDKLKPAPAEWNFFPSQNAQMLSELVGNIALYGQTTPARVWKQADGTYMILGGHTRFQALTKLHEMYQSGNVELEQDFDTMWCSVYDTDVLNEVDARQIVIMDNTLRRENSKSLKIRAQINLMRLEQDTRAKRSPLVRRKRIAESVADILGISPSQVNKNNRLQNLIPDFWDAYDTNEITQQFAEVLASLTPDIQNYIFQNKLYKNKITAQIRAALKKAQSIAEVDEAFASPQMYWASAKVEVSDPIPDNYKPILLFASKDEYEKVKSIIEWDVCASNEVSEETKKILRKMFAAQ